MAQSDASEARHVPAPRCHDSEAGSTQPESQARRGRNAVPGTDVTPHVRIPGGRRRLVAQALPHAHRPAAARGFADLIWIRTAFWSGIGPALTLFVPPAVARRGAETAMCGPQLAALWIRKVGRERR